MAILRNCYCGLWATNPDFFALKKCPKASVTSAPSAPVRGICVTLRTGHTPKLGAINTIESGSNG